MEITDTKLKSILLTLFNYNLDCSLYLNGTFYIREIEGEYGVGTEDEVDGNMKNIDWEKVFDNLGDAIDFFLEKRRELNYGDDLRY